MKISVLGARGMLGRDMVVAGLRAGHEVLAFDHSELDVTNEAQLTRRMNIDRPDAVINCAAWTDVDGAESEPEAAFAINGAGAGKAAKAAAEVGARVVYISSDYVFDGEKSGSYLESDTPRPISKYGESKLEGENATFRANRLSYVVRSSWLFGLGGTNFVDTMLQLGKSQGQVLVVHDQVGSPTYTWHLACGVIRLLDSDAYGLHHMAASGCCSWYEFAIRIFEEAGMEVVTLSATTEMVGRRAARPRNSTLGTASRYPIELPPWEEGLVSYLAERSAQEVEASR